MEGLFDGRCFVCGSRGLSFTSHELTDQLSTPLGLHPLVLVMGNEGNGIHSSTRMSVDYTWCHFSRFIRKVKSRVTECCYGNGYIAISFLFDAGLRKG